MTNEKTYFVYIMSNFTGTVLYVGVTNDIIRRSYEHRTHFYPRSFTAKYFVHYLVYYEMFGDVWLAIAREKQLKAGSRKKKVQLVKKSNPGWVDLAETFNDTTTVCFGSAERGASQ